MIGLYHGRIFFVFLFSAFSLDAELSLRFEAPEAYRDFSLHGQTAEDTATVFVREFGLFWRQALAPQWDPAYRLELEVLDFDLAGEVDPFSHPANPDRRRITRAYPPSAEMRYRLIRKEDGSVVEAGIERVRDLQFLDPRHGREMQFPAFRYEFAMLRRWVETTFAESALKPDGS